MDPPAQKFGHEVDFRRKTTLGVALVGLLFLTPFAINNFFQGRHFLGAGSLAIVAILAVNAWGISRGRYYPSLTSLVLVPAILFFLVLSVRTQGIVGALWCYPAVLAFYFMLPERKAWIANVFLLGLALPQVWGVVELSLAARVAVTLLAVSVFSAIFIRVITDQQEKLQAQAVMDPLTGLLNRTLLRESLEQAVMQSIRSGVPMTLVNLDIDHFKAINDSLGHDAGDTVLQGMGEVFLKRVRRVDKLFRQGGEEFLALLYGTDWENGQRVAEDLRYAIASYAFLPDCPVTVSVGVATLLPGEDWRKWMKRSDDNLYRAKSGGRNQVVA